MLLPSNLVQAVSLVGSTTVGDWGLPERPKNQTRSLFTMINGCELTTEAKIIYKTWGNGS